MGYGDHEHNRCFFCGSEKIILPWIGIAMGMSGFDYSFCVDCLKNMTAEEFWQSFFASQNFPWPPKLMSEAQKAFDAGIDPGELMYGSDAGAVSSSPMPRRRSTKNIQRETERGKMTNSLRYKVMRGDHFHCQLCGATGKDDLLVVDHIVPIARGGKTEEANLRTLCRRCNSGKGVKKE